MRRKYLEKAISLAVKDATAPSIAASATATPIEENSGAGQVIYSATATDESQISYQLKATTTMQHSQLIAAQAMSR